MNNQAHAALDCAKHLVSGDRAETHGEMLAGFGTIAEFWTTYLVARGDPAGRPLTADEVCDMMELLKVARRLGGKHNADDYIDAAGYAACALQCCVEGGEDT